MYTKAHCSLIGRAYNPQPLIEHPDAFGVRIISMHRNSCCVRTANLYAKQWRKPENRSEELPPRVFHIQANSGIFSEYYDEVQELLKSMAGMDEFLQGINMD